MVMEFDGLVQGTAHNDYAIAIMGDTGSITEGGDDFIRQEIALGAPPEFDAFAAAHGIS